MRSQNEPKVNTAYKGVVADVNELLEQVKQAVHDDGSYQTITWGHYGSINHVREELMRLMMFLTMKDPNADEIDFLENLDKKLKNKRGAK